MTSVLNSADEPTALLACTVCRDVETFDLLIEDMETTMGEAWGDLGLDEAFVFLGQDEANSLDFIALAIDEEDEDNLTQITQIISAAKVRDIKVILIAEDVTPTALHKLLRGGADEFIPYPLPEGELASAIERLKAADVAANATQAEAPKSAQLEKSEGEGVVIAAHGICGGSGATTFAVNLAWELATGDKKHTPSVCILDLGLQFGSVSTYLDLPRRDAVFEFLQDVESADEDSFAGALASFEDKVRVLTAPADILPLDLISPADVEHIIRLARDHFDFVIVDMPSTLVQWSEIVLQTAEIYFCLLELDMRSAQNTLRLRRTLEQENLPFDKIRFVLNRAPKFTDIQGKSRAKRLAESLGISIDAQMPDGGKIVTQACDHGLPLASQAAKNPLRKEINKLALSILSVGQSTEKAA